MFDICTKRDHVLRHTLCMYVRGVGSVQVTDQIPWAIFTTKSKKKKKKKKNYPESLMFFFSFPFPWFTWLAFSNFLISQLAFSNFQNSNRSSKSLHLYHSLCLQTTQQKNNIHKCSAGTVLSGKLGKRDVDTVFWKWVGPK